MELSNKNQKVSKVVWAIAGGLFGSGVGAIIGIIAYNKQWLG
ncbi:MULTISPECIES: hypothetical protein [Bacillaceae]|nr:hypothetical protein [Bacillus infantis]MDW2878244.1 hypothetical protein [Bacillus infantis]